MKKAERNNRGKEREIENKERGDRQRERERKLVSKGLQIQE